MEKPIDFNFELIRQLTRIADSLERMANGGEPTAAPDLRAPIEDFLSYDWEAIGATVVNSDREGPSTVEYLGKLWTRRSGNNPDFGPAIWFSRSTGKDEKGQNQYACLIKFQQVRKAKALPENAAELAAKGALANKPAASIPAATFTPPLTKSETPQVIALRAQFVKLGTTKAFNLAPEFAGWLFDKVKGDVEIGKQLLPVAAEAKAGGMDGKAITGLLTEGRFDPDKCLELVRQITAAF
jgi:hypothetical protein